LGLGITWIRGLSQKIQPAAVAIFVVNTQCFLGLDNGAEALKRCKRALGGYTGAVVGVKGGRMGLGITWIRSLWQIRSSAVAIFRVERLKFCRRLTALTMDLPRLADTLGGYTGGR
jgi:hypothetical protein